MFWGTNIDLAGSELQNASMHKLAQAPANPVLGQIYYSTASNTFQGYNGAWIDLGQVLTGANIVSLINASTSIIEDNNLSTNVGDAITKRHSHANSAILAAIEVAFTSAMSSKLNGISTGANKVVDSATNGNILIDGSEVTVYTQDFHGYSALLSSVSDDELLIYDSVNAAYKKITKANFVAGLGGEEYVLITYEEEFTATANQTAFNLTKGAYAPNANRIQVFVNGIRQFNTAFTETSGTSITMETGLEAGDKVLVSYISAMTAPEYLHASSHITGGNDVIPDAVAGGASGLMSGTMLTKLNGIAAGAEVNQNAFSTIKVSGQTDVVAGVKSAPLTFAAGTGITLTTDAANGKVTIAGVNQYVHPNHTGDVSSTGDGVTAIGANKVLNTMLRDSAALSVIGNATNATADPADITAGADGYVLRRSGTALGFGTVATAGIADNAVTLAKMAQMATSSLLGRATAAAGNVEVLTAAQVRTILNVADGANNYVHPSTDGNLHVPATGTGNNGKILKAGSTAGSFSWGSLVASEVGAVPASDAVTAAAANKLLYLNANSKLPASITGDADGNAATATKLAAAKAISISGDGTGSANFDGNIATNIALTLANVVTAGTYPKITFNAKGLVTGGAALVAADIPALNLAKISDAGTAASKNTGTSSGNVPILDANGKLDTSILPALAIIDTYVVASEAAMLALTAQRGDVAIRTDIRKNFILQTEGASTLANWQELLVPADVVTSVAGKTGVVTLVASDVGLGNVTNESKATMFTNAALTGVPTAPTAAAATNNTQIATTAYVKSQGYLTTNAVTSVSGKTGAVTLVSSDVGLGNVENKSSATIRSEITSSNITTGLGYTPAKKYVASIGDATNTYFTLTHGLNTMDITVFIRNNAAPYDQIMTEVQIVDANNVKILFSKPPTLNQYRVVITG